MNGVEHIPMAGSSRLAIPEIALPSGVSSAPKLSALAALRAHCPEYLMEAGLLGAFMVSACVFGTLFEFSGSPIHAAIQSGFLRRVLMGVAMGLTAVAIIYSPWGRQSGAHINPCVTFTFFRLGRIRRWDAFFYLGSQFAGAALGVAVVALFLGDKLADPAIRYVATVPGEYGAWVALLAEFLIAFGMMAAVLYFSNHDRLARYTGLVAGLLVATYITLEAPLSGMSMNPARTFGSALSAHLWSAIWVYFTAPLLGMLAAAELYLWRMGRAAVRCCKLHHDSVKRCIFCGANGGFAS